ncbi:hypothetical protein [Mesorhizobium sp. M1396]
MTTLPEPQIRNGVVGAADFVVLVSSESLLPTPKAVMLAELSDRT